MRQHKEETRIRTSFASQSFLVPDGTALALRLPCIECLHGQRPYPRVTLIDKLLSEPQPWIKDGFVELDKKAKRAPQVACTEDAQKQGKSTPHVESSHCQLGSAAHFSCQCFSVIS
eukprot:6468479-Amphidinium_carterae.1